MFNSRRPFVLYMFTSSESKIKACSIQKLAFGDLERHVHAHHMRSQSQHAGRISQHCTFVTQCHRHFPAGSYLLDFSIYAVFHRCRDTDCKQKNIPSLRSNCEVYNSCSITIKKKKEKKEANDVRDSVKQVLRSLGGKWRYALLWG